MSGRKYTTISLNSDEYTRLREAERQLQAVQNNLPEVLEGLRRQSSGELQSRLSPLEQRQERFQREMAQVNASMTALERETAAEFAQTNAAMSSLERETAAEFSRQQRETVERLARQRQETLQRLAAQERQTAQQLAQQDRDLRQALQQTAGNLRAETRRLLKEQDERLTTLIEQEGRERRAQVTALAQQVEQEGRERKAQGAALGQRIEQESKVRGAEVANLQSQINGMVSVQLRQKQVAQILIDQADTQRTFIEQNYRHQRFARGQLEKLQRDLEQAKASQELAPQAALAQAQDAYNGLSDLRLELERLEREWEVWRSAALESARRVLEQAQRNRKCQALGRDGKAVDLSIEVDWWTHGKLSQLEEQAKRLVAKLAEQDAGLSTEELQRVVEKSAPELRQQVEDVISEARLAVLSSQVRSNIADLAVQALEARGFTLQDGTYEGEDMRYGFAAKVKDLSGTEIVVHVTPVQDDPARNELTVNTYLEQGRTEPHELQERAKEVVEILKAQRLNVPPATGDLNSRGDERVRDIEKVRHLKPEQLRAATA